MKITRLAFSAIIGGMIGASAAPVMAQDSDTLKVLISPITHGPKTITLRFLIVNRSDRSIYIRNFSFNKAEDFTLSSGDTLQTPQVTGVQECRHDLNNCLGQSGTDINEYSEVAPGKSLRLNLFYRTQTTLNKNDTISGNVALITRTESQATALKTFSFDDKPIN